MRPLGFDNNGQYRQKKLGEMLLDASLINEGQLQTALTKQQRSRKKLGEILINLGFTNEELVLNLLGKQLNSPYVKLSETDKIDHHAADKVPENLAQNNQVLPFKMEGDTLWVAMSDPANQFLKNVLELMTGYTVKPYIASPKELKRAISAYYAEEGRFAVKGGKTKTHSYFLPLKQLGFTPRALQLYEKYLENQKGCVLLIGPEDSGKKTTVYATLKELNFPDNDIISIERNIDYNLDKINQLETSSQDKMDQEQMLEYVNQFNPNILAVENVQGKECWGHIGRMAEKGNLVLATINTDQSLPDFLADFASRRTDHYSVLENLSLMIEQKLVKAVCPCCKTALSISKNTARKMGLAAKDKNLTVYEGRGCKVCNFTGNNGYTACYGILPVNNKIKELMMQKNNSAKLKRAIKKEMTFDLDNMLQEKLLRGQISIAEYLAQQGKDLNQFSELKEHKLAEVFWHMFEKSGSVNAFLEYSGKRAKN